MGEATGIGTARVSSTRVSSTSVSSTSVSSASVASAGVTPAGIATTSIGSSVSEDPTGRGAPAASRPAGVGAARRPVALLVATAAALIALDVITKHLAVAKLSGRNPVEVIPGVLDLELTRNSGAAFSIAGGSTVVLSLVALLVIGVVVFTARRLRSTGWAVVLGALLGGAIGNLIDRIFRAPGPLRGHVVDFVHLHHWPIFNVADSAIVCGGVLAVLLSLRGVGLDGSHHTDTPDGARRDGATPEHSERSEHSEQQAPRG
ncbi:signal peptidase II [Frankia sp. AgPm24]|uniref:signal peptidase II n=1 Tax=Frankia sp. AgPm24 TaxID=631128 RepID=UPI00200F3F7B|nr:signal peptidase II [Frankia sp. AgPm24]MCK9922382.1 signal peptidase II [Frankia sp. AgPm24]